MLFKYLHYLLKKKFVRQFSGENKVWLGQERYRKCLAHPSKHTGVQPSVEMCQLQIIHMVLLFKSSIWCQCNES